METTDGQIILRVLAGDRSSFDVLIQRHAAPLWSTLRAATADREDAREIFQETWTRAFERLDSLREPHRLRSWLLSIALNLLRQRMRRPRPGSLEPERPPQDHRDRERVEPAAEQEAVGAALERGELVELLRAEIERLPNRQREVVDLRLNHELSHVEIAGLLGISPESSRANYYQAMRRLRARFDRLDPNR